MSAWSWSLLQFTIVLTAMKELPKLNNSQDEKIKVVETNKPKNNFSSVNSKTAGKPKNSSQNGKTLSSSNGINGKLLNQSKAEHNSINKNKGKRKVGIEIIQIPNDTPREEREKRKREDQLQAKEELAAVLQGRRCFDYFCCYNEIWGMAMSIFFQDGPFLIIRLVILLHYKVVTQMNIFFLGKNVFVIVLLLNRIRVVFREERQPWKIHMNKAKEERHKSKNESRRALGLQPKTKL